MLLHKAMQDKNEDAQQFADGWRALSQKMFCKTKIP
jgi:hypothetical protein